jgi:transcriptional regulator with XRE-family HTH domain
MDYGKAIRIVRALADIPQRELARRMDVDPSLISMLEAGKTEAKQRVLGAIRWRISECLFTLLILLASESGNTKTNNPEAIQRLALELAGLAIQEGRRWDGNRLR